MEKNEKKFIKKHILSIISKYTYQQKPVGVRVFADNIGMDTFSGKLIALFNWVDKCTVIGKYTDNGTLNMDPVDWYVSQWDTEKFLEKLLQNIDIEELFLEVFYNEDLNLAVEDILEKEIGVKEWSEDLDLMINVFKTTNKEEFHQRRVLFKIGLLEEGEDF